MARKRFNFDENSLCNVCCMDDFYTLCGVMYEENGETKMLQRSVTKMFVNPISNKKIEQALYSNQNKQKNGRNPKLYRLSKTQYGETMRWHFFNLSPVDDPSVPEGFLDVEIDE